MGTVDLNDEDLEDYVSVPVLQELAKNFIRSFGAMMASVGYEKSWLKCQMDQWKRNRKLQLQSRKTTVADAPLMNAAEI